MIAERFEHGRDTAPARGTAGPRESHATILFVDVQGFTAVAERLAPARLARWLGAWLEAMAAAIRGAGGEIEQLLGDGLLASFSGHPRATAADARAAARAMAVALAALNRDFAAAGRPTITMRIGIATGTVARGPLALGRAGASLLLGDTVNVAARLEALDPALVPVPPAGARILLDGATAGWLDDPVGLEPIGTLALDGRDAPVPVVRLRP